MPQFFTASSTQVFPLGPTPCRVTNSGGGTLYIGGPAVSSGSNNLSIATTASRTVPGGVGNDYCIASAAGPVVIEELSAPVREAGDFAPNAVFSDHLPLALSTGTDTAMADGQTHFKAVQIPVSGNLTGVQYLIGSVGGTDKVISVLYDDKGNVLTTSALAGTTVGTANTVQLLAFTTPYSVVGPGKYHIGVQQNGATGKIRTMTAGLFAKANIATGGTFGTVIAITPPTTGTGASFIGATY